MNLKGIFSKDDGLHWAIIWGVGVWKLWLWGNASIFEEDFIKPQNPVLVLQCIWQSYASLQDSCVISGVDIDSSLLWSPPKQQWVKVNVDGAVAGDGASAGCGVVIGDHEGNWIAGLSHYLGSCSVQEAEEWAILKGLNLAWDLGLRQVTLESDAKGLIDVLLSMPQENRCSLLLHQIQLLHLHSCHLRICFIPRDQNKVADHLAKAGLLASNFLDSCPPELVLLVNKEKLEPSVPTATGFIT